MLSIAGADRSRFVTFAEAVWRQSKTSAKSGRFLIRHHRLIIGLLWRVFDVIQADPGAWICEQPGNDKEGYDGVPGSEVWLGAPKSSKTYLRFGTKHTSQAKLSSSSQTVVNCFTKVQLATTKWNDFNTSWLFAISSFLSARRLELHLNWSCLCFYSEHLFTTRLSLRSIYVQTPDWRSLSVKAIVRKLLWFYHHQVIIQ